MAAALWWVCSGRVAGAHTRVGLWNLPNISFSHLFTSRALWVDLSKQPPTWFPPSVFPYSYIFISASVSLDDVKINAESMLVVSSCKTFCPKLSSKENFRNRAVVVAGVYSTASVRMRMLILRPFCSIVLWLCLHKGHTDTCWERTFISLFNTGWFILLEHKDNSLLRLWIILASWL